MRLTIRILYAMRESLTYVEAIGIDAVVGGSEKEQNSKFDDMMKAKDWIDQELEKRGK